MKNIFTFVALLLALSLCTVGCGSKESPADEKPEQSVEENISAADGLTAGDVSDSEQSEEGGQGAEQPSASPEAGNIWPEGEPLPIPSEFAPTESAKEYHAVNGQELMDLLSIESNLDLSDSVIYLDGGDYEIFDICLGECNNLSIIGTGDTHIYSTSGSETIFYAYNCNNLLLCGLVMGHEIPTEDECSSGVVALYDCRNVQILGCDIYGCGLVGIDTANAEMTVQYTTIRDCSAQAASVSNSTLQFANCTFSGNSYLYSDNVLFYIDESSHVTLSDCALLENKSSAKYGSLVWDEESSAYNSIVYENTFEENGTYEDGNGW